MQLLLGRWYWGAFKLFMNLDVLADFFFGFFIRFANTFGFTGGIGNCDKAHSYNCGPTYFHYGVHFFFPFRFQGVAVVVVRQMPVLAWVWVLQMLVPVQMVR